MEQISRSELFENQAEGLCGGRGSCGRCRVRFLREAPLPSAADRKFFSPEELRLGWRLACTAKPAGDCALEVCFAQDMGRTKIVTWSDAGLQEEACTVQKQTKTAVICVIDLGTTTVVMQYIDKISGDILCTHAFLNPQRMYGSDVMARICHAEKGNGRAMRDGLLKELKKGFVQMSPYGEPERVIVSGNTTMGHLLMGYPVSTLGAYPFTPYSLEKKEFDLLGHRTVLLPGISAFVGADIVSGIYACGMAERDELSLLIDLGTNGEMVIGNKEKLWCSAAAAGSSFEGDITARAMGTDIVALAFEMLKDGVMDVSGLMEEPYFTHGWKKETVVMKQQDIRNLQLAKAAICAGVSVLLKKAQAWDQIAYVYLAGGFGYELDVGCASAIGLIPAVLKEKCQAVGNTSLAGAVKYGRSRNADAELEHIVRISRPLNLAKLPEFEDRYIRAMNFEEIWK